MFFPLIPVLSTICAALGLYSLYWYENLSKEEKQEADRLASQYAMNLYNKGLDQLSKQQLGRVHDLVKRHFAP
jgi:hypothetical protein